MLLIHMHPEHARRQCRPNSVAGILAGQPGEAELATRVETVRRHLGRRNGAPKRKKEPKPE
jgi:hypothetical protein